MDEASLFRNYIYNPRMQAKVENQWELHKKIINISYFLVKFKDDINLSPLTKNISTKNIFYR